jgi:fatty acyl-CoA reductase
MRMMDMAEECQRLQSFVHVSTAYANSNREGFVEEKVYDLPGNEDPADVIQNILKMNPQYIMDHEKELIGTYPNTYTYTKSMAERSMKVRLGNLKCAIVRPSIIICANSEPVPGWIDSLAAAGGMVFSFTSGLMHYVPCNG